MEETLLAIIGIVLAILGLIATWYSAKYYYNKGEKIYSLSASVNPSGELIPKEDHIKRDLLVSYKNEKVDTLRLYQFVIVNNGTEPLTSFIKPMELYVPKYLKILNVKIGDIEPQNRDIGVISHADLNKIQFNIDLLNSGEGFVVDLIASLNINTNENQEVNIISDVTEFYLTLTTPNLPAKISIKNNSLIAFLHSDIYEILKPLSKIFIVTLRVMYHFVQFVGVLLLSLILLIALNQEKYNPFKINQFFENFDLGSLAILLSILITIPMLILSFYSFVKVTNKNERFKLPFEGQEFKHLINKINKW